MLSTYVITKEFTIQVQLIQEKRENKMHQFNFTSHQFRQFRHLHLKYAPRSPYMGNPLVQPQSHPTTCIKCCIRPQPAFQYTVLSQNAKIVDIFQIRQLCLTRFQIMFFDSWSTPPPPSPFPSKRTLRLKREQRKRLYRNVTSVDEMLS